MRPVFRVTVGGRDISGMIADRLISLTVTDSAGVQSDSVLIVLDDRDQRLVVPPTKTVITVAIGYDDALVDKGTFTVEELELEGPDRRLTIRGNAPGASKGAWASKERSWHGKTLGEIAQTISSERGWQPTIAHELAQIRLPHEDQTENDLQFLSRLAAKNGGVAKVTHGRLILTRHAEAKRLSGQPLPVLEVKADQMTEWSMTTTERGAYDGVAALYYDVKKAERGEVVAGTKSSTTHKLTHTYSSQAAAQRAARSKREQLQRGARTLSIRSMPGIPSIEAEQKIRFTGLRSGVDGEWIVNTAIHELTDSGYTCRLECETPKV